MTLFSGSIYYRWVRWKDGWQGDGMNEKVLRDLTDRVVHES